MCQGLTNINNQLKFPFGLSYVQSVAYLIILCISDRNLIILLKFNTKVTLVKDRSFPHLRILLLYTDQLFCLIVTWINSLYLFFLSLFTPLADVMQESML